MEWKRDLAMLWDDIKACEEARAGSLLSLMMMCGVETAGDCMISASDPAVKQASATSTVRTTVSVMLFLHLVLTTIKE